MRLTCDFLVAASRKPGHGDLRRCCGRQARAPRVPLPSPEGCLKRAKQRANGARLRATPTDGQRQYPQVNRPSGNSQRRRNTQKIWFASRRPGVRVPLAPPFFEHLCPSCQQGCTATSGYSASSGSAASGGAQGVAEPLECRERRLVRHHRVDLHRDRDLAVSQDRHSHTRASGAGVHLWCHTSFTFPKIAVDSCSAVDWRDSRACCDSPRRRAHFWVLAGAGRAGGDCGAGPAS